MLRLEKAARIVLLATVPVACWSAAPPALDPELLRSSQEINQQLEQSGLLLGDQSLDSYMQSIADRLHSAGPAVDQPKPRVRVLKGAMANAFALPDGSVYVTSELLVRLRNEAQLATVLGHELVHYTQRHAQRQQKAEGRRNTVSTLFTLLLAGLAGSATGSSSVAQSIAVGSEESRRMWMLASMSGYSQDLEREADRMGFDLLRSAGFDARQAPALFSLLDDGESTGAAATPPKFASHPQLAERRASYEALLAASGTSSAVSVEADQQMAAAWSEQMGDLARRQLQVKLDQRDYAGGTKLAQDVGRQWPDDGRVDFLAGELLRLGRQPEPQAVAAYERAVAKQGAPPDAWRQLGYLYRRSGREARAAEAFSRYLGLVPNAVEAPLLREFIQRAGTTTPAPGAEQ